MKKILLFLLLLLFYFIPIKNSFADVNLRNCSVGPASGTTTDLFTVKVVRTLLLYPDVSKDSYTIYQFSNGQRGEILAENVKFTKEEDTAYSSYSLNSPVPAGKYGLDIHLFVDNKEVDRCNTAEINVRTPEEKEALPQTNCTVSLAPKVDNNNYNKGVKIKVLAEGLPDGDYRWEVSLPVGRTEENRGKSNNGILKFTLGDPSGYGAEGRYILSIYNSSNDLACSQVNFNVAKPSINACEITDLKQLPTCRGNDFPPDTLKSCQKNTDKGYFCAHPNLEVLCVRTTPRPDEPKENDIDCEKPPPPLPPCSEFSEINIKGEVINVWTKQQFEDKLKNEEFIGKNIKTNFKCTKVNTGVLDINTSPEKFVGSIMGLILGLSGGIAVLLIIVSGYRFMSSQGNPEKVQGAKESLTSAIVGLLFIIFALVILEIIGVDILHIFPGR